MSIYTLAIPGWSPTPLNRLIGCHWGTAAKRKAHDRDILGTAVVSYCVLPAFRRRRVSLMVVLPKGKRATDPDSLWKSTLDALVHHGAIKNDNKEWVELGKVEFARGPELMTILTLEDV